MVRSRNACDQPGGLRRSLNRWLDRLRHQGWQGAEKVFGWSFYSQGTREDQATSADPFIHAALKWFGDPDATVGSPWEKGERLAQLVRNHKTLLLLDGLEPLQYAPIVGQKVGALRDPSLATLLRELALHNPALCILTTRIEVDDLAQHRSGTAPVVELEQLSPQGSAAMLKKLGVQGTEAELQEASQAFAGHALALTLLGTYLSEVHSGDVRHWREVPLLEEDASKGGHARRVMQSYQKCLRRSPEWSLLRLIGFFDRPAKGAEIQALLNDPPIGGLTKNLRKLDSTSQKRVLARLRRLRLLTESSPDDPDGMDAHPLLRDYLSEQLQQHHPEACREGHRRLYEHLKRCAKELPETLEEMMPLYHAVGHGCRVGLHDEVYSQVYFRRIKRRNEFFPVTKLGAFGSQLAALSSFFLKPWHSPHPGLSDRGRWVSLGEAGFYLRALGRLSEAAEPMRAALEAARSSENWKNAAVQASNLSELHLTLGDLLQAVDDARHSVELADRSGDAEKRMINRTTLADALHQSGDLGQARSLFQEAERMQKEDDPQFPLLYSLRGFQYCDLLLGECESPTWIPQASPALSRQDALPCCRQVRERATQTLEWVESWQKDILSAALDHLTLGRTFLLEAVLDAPSPDPLSPAQHHLDRAVTGLRQAGTTHHQPRALIARAQLHRVQFQHSGDEAFAQRSQQDLDEAAQIASRGPMPLFQADIQREQSRLHHAQGHLDQASKSLSKARELIQKHGYHRRDAELEGMEKELGRL
ncbi:MAG: tetratricopeptide repeat protein [Acidobacteriota bacterium]